MRRPAIISALLCILFCSAFVGGKGASVVPQYPDSLRSVYLYTEGIKANLVARDTTRAAALFEEAINADPDFAPAHYELAGALLGHDDARAMELSRRAAELDTMNKWYWVLYGQSLIHMRQYDQALRVYRRLGHLDPQNPDVYRILAALYEMQQLPFSAIAVLDSAELRFGRIPLLGAVKRRLLLSTRQYDRAIDEAKALVETTPYEAEHHVALGEIYATTGRDSLALASFSAAMRIDSSDLATLLSLADFYNHRQNFRAFLGVSKRLFESESVPLDNKIDQFERLTSDMRFYREYYLQLNELASVLAIRYPNNPKVVDLYGKHLIASGEMEQALELFKHHTTDQPPVKEYFMMVIDIESYKQRPDSVEKYVAQAIHLFPQSPEFYISRGNVHSYGKHYTEALKSYRASLRHIPSDSLRSIVWGYIGDTYHAAGESKKSYKAYEKSLSYDQNNPMVLNNYAYFLAQEERQLERALEMSERALSLTQSNPTYLDTHAWVLYKLGRIPEAKKSAQLAVSLDRDKSPELMLHYGDILAAGGEKFMAEVYWRKALENGYSDAEAIERRFQSLREPKPKNTDTQ